MKKHLYKFAIIFFCILFILFPLLSIITKNLLTFLVIIVVISFLLYFLSFKIKVKIPKKYLLLIIFCISFLIRLICVLLLNKYVVQVGDFDRAYMNAFSLNYTTDNYRVFTHWVLISELNHYLFKIFGSYQLVSLIFNSLITSFVSLLTYLISFEIFHNKKIAFLASMMYVFWPSMILYNIIFLPDHIASLLILLCIYLALKLFNFESNSVKVRIIYTFLIGVCIGISIFFKNFSQAFLIALCIYLFLEFLKTDVWKLTLKKYFYLAIIFLCFLVTKNIMFIHIENQVGASVVKDVSPCYLNVGLNSAGNGFYDSNLYSVYFNMYRENNYDYKKTNNEIMKQLKSDIKTNYRLLPEKFIRKAFVLQNDNIKLDWIKISLSNDNIKSNLDNIYSINNIYYLIIICFMLISLFLNIKAKDNKLLFLYVFIFGSLLMIMLIETQARYTYAVQPLYCICTGLLFSSILCRRNIKKNKK